MTRDSISFSNLLTVRGYHISLYKMIEESKFPKNNHVKVTRHILGTTISWRNPYIAIPNIGIVKTALGLTFALFIASVDVLDIVDFNSISKGEVGAILFALMLLIIVIVFILAVLEMIINANVSHITFKKDEISIYPGGKPLKQYFKREPDVENVDIPIIDIITNFFGGRGFSASKIEVTRLDLCKNNDSWKLQIGNVIKEIEIGRYLSNESKEILFNIIDQWRKNL